MDRIRRALDLARVERAQAAIPAPEATDAGPAPAPEVRSPPEGNPPAVISYVRSHVFTPSAELLERNRIFGPGSSEPAAVAYRMLRTQVLQRMDANGWLTLGIFSPGPEDGKTTTAINLAVSLARATRPGAPVGHGQQHAADEERGPSRHHDLHADDDHE